MQCGVAQCAVPRASCSLQYSKLFAAFQTKKHTQALINMQVNKKAGDVVPYNVNVGRQEIFNCVVTVPSLRLFGPTEQLEGALLRTGVGIFLSRASNNATQGEKNSSNIYIHSPPDV